MCYFFKPIVFFQHSKIAMWPMQLGGQIFETTMKLDHNSLSTERISLIWKAAGLEIVARNDK